METKTDGWDDFISGDFLKAVNVNSENDAFVVTDISLFRRKENDSDNLRLTVERDGKEWDFDLNKTNAVFLKNAGIQSPKLLLGKKLFFKKALVRNPQTQKEVEGLRIWKVE